MPQIGHLLQQAYHLAASGYGFAFAAGCVFIAFSDWLSWPYRRLRYGRAKPVEIVFADRQPFRGRARENVGDGDDLEFDYYFIGVRNPTNNKSAHNMRVRVVGIGNIQNMPELDLVYTQWFDRNPFNGRTSVDLAPNQTSYFQFLFQLLDLSKRYGIRIRSECGGYGIWTETPLTIKVAAFCQQGSDIVEFVLSPGPDRLATLRPKRNIAP